MERLICKQVESVHIPVQMNSNEIYLMRMHHSLRLLKKKIKK